MATSVPKGNEAKKEEIRVLLGYWRWHTKSNIVHASPELSRQFCIDPREAMRGAPLKLFSSAVCSEDRSRFDNVLAGLAASGDDLDISYRIGGDNHRLSVVGSGRRVSRNEYVGSVHAIDSDRSPLDLATDHLIAAKRAINPDCRLADLGLFIDMGLIEAGQRLAER